MSKVNQNYNAVRVTFGDTVIYADMYNDYRANLTIALKSLCILYDLHVKQDYTFKDLLDEYAKEMNIVFTIEPYHSNVFE